MRRTFFSALLFTCAALSGSGTKLNGFNVETIVADFDTTDDSVELARAELYGLLAALLRQQITGRSRAENLAQEMTADLSRLALVARRTSNAVVITDVQRRIEDPLARKLFGHIIHRLALVDQPDHGALRAETAA